MIFSPGAWLATAVDWLNTNFHPQFDALVTIVSAVVGGVQAALLFAPALVVIAVVLLSLAMVVLAGLVGAGGLGAEVTRGLTRIERGLGIRAGLAIVAVAILLDGLLRAALQRDHAPG